MQLPEKSGSCFHAFKGLNKIIAVISANNMSYILISNKTYVPSSIKIGIPKASNFAIILCCLACHAANPSMGVHIAKIAQP